MTRRKKWEWPATPMDPTERERRLGDAHKANICYSNQPVLGFPGTAPLRVAVEAARPFLASQANNIGLHTHDKQTEMGFGGTQALEREFVYSLASLIGSVDPEREIDGYICNGGTEGNDHGMWLGRNWLWKNVSPISEQMRPGIVVITSHLAHYSVEKEYNRLLGAGNISTNPFEHNNLSILATDENGRLTAAILEEEIRKRFEEGYRRFLIFLTAGTINVGSIDPVSKIDVLLARLEEEFSKYNARVGFYIHVDAAFGGFVIPFARPHVKFGFENTYVRSVSIDAHKMGYVPYSAGVFLCRKGLLSLTTTEAKYLYGHEDSTVPGSRSGATAVACWTAMQTLSFEGYARRADHCMRLAELLRQNLRQEFDSVERFFYPSELNIVTLRPSGKLKLAIEEKNGGQALWEKYLIPQIKDFPECLTHPFPPGKVGTTVYRFVFMPHCGTVDVQRFIEHLHDVASRVSI